MGNRKKRAFNFIVYMVPRTDRVSHGSYNVATEDPEGSNAELEEGYSNVCPQMPLLPHREFRLNLSLKLCSNSGCS